MQWLVGVDNLGFESDRISLPGLHPQNKDTSPTGATAMDNSDKVRLYKSWITRLSHFFCNIFN